MDNEHVDRLLKIWQPAAISSLCTCGENWTDLALNWIGEPWQHPLFLPTGSVIKVGNETYEILPQVASKQIDKIGVTCRGVRSQESGMEFLLVVNSAGRGCIVVTSQPVETNELEWQHITRVKCSLTEFELSQDLLNSINLALSRLPLPEEVETELMTGKIRLLVAQHPAYSGDFLGKALLLLEESDEELPQLLPEGARLHEQFDRFRERLDVDRIFHTNTFTAETISLLSQLSRRIEKQFCSPLMHGRMHDAAFLFLIASYNRLVARQSGALFLVSPEDDDWLGRATAQAFRRYRLLFNYWLIFTESALCWWNSPSHGEKCP